MKGTVRLWFGLEIVPGQLWLSSWKEALAVAARSWKALAPW